MPRQSQSTRRVAASRRAAYSSRLARLRTTFEHWADARTVPVAAWLLRRTKGRIVRLWHRRALVLTTHGRRSGRDRTVVVQYFPAGNDMIVVAANGGMPTNPGWYFNLASHPEAQVEVDGRTISVRAHELSRREADAFWPRVLDIAPDYARYRRRTTRTIPLIRLVPVDGPT